VAMLYSSLSKNTVRENFKKKAEMVGTRIIHEGNKTVDWIQLAQDKVQW
jgi:hypothetical protein